MYPLDRTFQKFLTFHKCSIDERTYEILCPDVQIYDIQELSSVAVAVVVTAVSILSFFRL
jgi:hypothetical protein